MILRKEFKVREMAGEHIIVMPGRHGADMTRVVALNGTSLYLWEALRDRNFTEEDVVTLLVERYEVEAPTARHDAAAWIASLAECGIIAE